MILDTFDSILLMPNSHDNTRVGPGCDLKFLRESGMRPSKRVVSSDSNVLRDISVDATAIVFDLRGFTVNNFSSIRNITTKNRENTLPIQINYN